ncbi:unnamed protein product [Ectocarpus sp. CCAP 1310/34]|nr:unnamed protein product [Ectocarpus sp. CCAP 1310/34]
MRRECILLYQAMARMYTLVSSRELQSFAGDDEWASTAVGVCRCVEDFLQQSAYHFDGLGMLLQLRARVLPRGRHTPAMRRECILFHQAVARSWNEQVQSLAHSLALLNVD